MTTQEIEAYSVASKEALQSERVLDCFSNLSPLLKELGEWWAINREEELLNIYKQMIKYLIRGVEDPYQKGVYNRFKNDVYVLIDDVSDALQVRVSSLFEYRMRRFQSSSSINTLNLYFQEFKEYGIKHKICVETGSDFHSLESSRLDYEHSIADMFLSVWLTHRCQNSDIELMKCII